MNLLKGIGLFAVCGIVIMAVAVISNTAEICTAFTIATVGAAIVTELSALRNNKDK